MRKYKIYYTVKSLYCQVVDAESAEEAKRLFYSSKSTLSEPEYINGMGELPVVEEIENIEDDN